MKNILTFNEFINESKNVQLDKDIIDYRAAYDFTASIHNEVNEIVDIVKKVFAKKDIKIKRIILHSRNQFDGYQLYIDTDSDELIINVDFGTMGLEDQREGYINLKYGRNQISVKKKSTKFGDIRMNINDYRKEIEKSLQSIIK